MTAIWGSGFSLILRDRFTLTLTHWRRAVFTLIHLTGDAEFIIWIGGVEHNGGLWGISHVEAIPVPVETMCAESAGGATGNFHFSLSHSVRIHLHLQVYTQSCTKILLIIHTVILKVQVDRDAGEVKFF